MLDFLEGLRDIICSIGTPVALIALIYQIYKDRRYNIEKQANSVAAWIDMDITEIGTAVVIISNDSELPIYEVVVSRDLLYKNESEESKNDNNCVYIQTVSSGKYKVDVQSTGGGMNKKFEASITFRDARGKYWSRNAAGKIKAIKQNSIDYRELVRPVSSSYIKKN